MVAKVGSHVGQALRSVRLTERRQQARAPEACNEAQCSSENREVIFQCHRSTFTILVLVRGSRSLSFDISEKQHGQTT
jgi:hypothetical protein